LPNGENNIRRNRRVKVNGEVFTPTPLVREILDLLPAELFTDPSKTFLDPSCGNGRFLLEILRRRLANGMDMAAALRTIYGVDLMQHNVDACRDRLLGDRTDLRHIVERNIVRADGMAYDYTFDAA